MGVRDRVGTSGYRLPVPAMSREQSIAVYVRVRSPGADVALRCLTTDERTSTVKLHTPAGSDDRTFRYDSVGGENTTQEEVFDAVGRPLSHANMEGYNATVFAYGQTGSGKTYTMYGPEFGGASSSAPIPSDSRGLTPRLLDELFAMMAREERRAEGGGLTFNCTASLLEIYNETITDLLDGYSAAITPSPAASTAQAPSLAPPTNLRLREDATRGVYVENITQECLRNSTDALHLLRFGVRQRSIGATAMNAESSRSHLVFTLTMEAVEEDSTSSVEESVRRVRTSQLNLVDLAGSERQKDTHATGKRLREACNINRSLSALGNVITSLAATAKHGGSRHVAYRDSKLTHLLRNSLGGNAQTYIIACVSPHERCFAETLSTLRFAQRAKLIRNHAVVNESTLAGSSSALLAEIAKLRQELATAKQGAVSILGQPFLQPSAMVDEPELDSAAKGAKGFDNAQLRIDRLHVLLVRAQDMAEELKVARDAAHSAGYEAGCSDVLKEKQKQIDALKMQLRLARENGGLADVEGTAEAEERVIAASGLLAERVKLAHENEQARREIERLSAKVASLSGGSAAMSELAQSQHECAELRQELCDAIRDWQVRQEALDLDAVVESEAAVEAAEARAAAAEAGKQRADQLLLEGLRKSQDQMKTLTCEYEKVINELLSRGKQTTQPAGQRPKHRLKLSPFGSKRMN